MGIVQKAKGYFEERRRSLAESYISQKLHPTGRHLLEFFGVGVGDLFTKEPRSIVPDLESGYGDFWPPPYNPFELQRIYESHWVVNACISKLVREATRHGYKWEPNYEVRCDVCETEFDFRPMSETCPECASTTILPPNREQLNRVAEFLERPNPDITISDILKRTISDLLIFDDAYVSIAKAGPGPDSEHATNATSGSALELWPEDVRYIQVIADKKGRLGGKTFCPFEESTKPAGEKTTLYDAVRFPPGSPCPKDDGVPLAEAAYVQTYGQEPRAAWTKDEMLHTNLYATGSRHYGTPKLWAIRAQVDAMQLIDVYQRDMFDKLKTPKAIYLAKGFEENALLRQLKSHEEKLKKNPVADMWLSAPMLPDGTVQAEIQRTPGIDTPLLQGAMEHQDYLFKAICYTFGVSPASIGVETSGKLGASQEGAEQRDVTPETINEIQVQVAEVYDDFIKRYFPEITDWSFRLMSAHEAEDADIWITKKVQMETAKTAVDAGFEVIIDEDGTPKISGEGKRQETQSQFGGFGGGTSSTRSTSAFGKHGPGAHDEPGHVGGYQPPAGIGAVGAKVYAECRSGGGDKTSCAKIAWTAQNRADKAIESVEKADRHKAIIDRAAVDYKAKLDSISEMFFSIIGGVISDVLEANIPDDNRMTPAVKIAFLERLQRSLDPELKRTEDAVKRFAHDLMARGAAEATQDAVARGLQKQSDVPPREQEIRSVEAMRNILYFGDKASYLGKIRSLTDQSIEENWSTSQLARVLRDTIDPEREHFSNYMWERIARTEAAAYVIEGERRAYEEFGIPKMKRLVAPDATDELCAPYADAIYRTADAYDVIPAHPNCLLPSMHVSGEFVAGLKTRYDGPAIEIVTASGKSLTATPNHRILTSDGFIPISQVHKGTNLIADPLWFKKNDVVDPNNEKSPAAIQDVFQMLSLLGPTNIVPSSTKDLNGDARWVNGQIDIVRAERSLRQNSDTMLDETIIDGKLPLGHPQPHSFSRSSTAKPRSQSVMCAPSGLPGGGQLAENGGIPPRADSLPLDSLRIGPPTNTYATLFKLSDERFSRDSDAVRNLLERCAGNIVFDPVVQIRIIDFSGHVFDLETKSGLYIAEGLYVHNCRCAFAPYFGDEEPIEPLRP